MRHHTNAFAYYNAVPTFGYGISEKIYNFFDEIGQNNMLIDPYKPEMSEIKSRIDEVLRNRAKISKKLKAEIIKFRKHMNQALDTALNGV